MIKTLKSQLASLDPVLLVFLLLVSQDKIVLKLAAIIFIFLLRFNFKLGLKENRLPLFYIAIAAVEILKYLFMGSHYLGNWATLLVSCIYWGLSFLALHQLRNNVDRNETRKTENTIIALSLVNFLFCISQLVQVMLVTHSLNPYSVAINAPDIRYPDIIFPYGHSSGDLIRGVFYDNHHNAIITQFIFIFLLYSRRFFLAFLNFFVIVIICFNLVTLLTMGVLFYYFVVMKDKRSRLTISGFAAFVFAFYILVTPENAGYLGERISNTFSSVTHDRESLKTETHSVQTPEFIRDDSIRAATEHVRWSRDSARTVTTVDTSYNIDEVSGKKIAYTQSYKFLKSHTLYAAVGCGAGMFSSKLANNFSGVFGGTLVSRKLPAPSYGIYFANHGSLNKYLTTLVIGKHSINNFPNSVYNQLLTEYGLLGMILFVVFYVWYFVKRFRMLKYGLLLIPLLLIYFNYGYYFETIDIVVFFELLMFLDLKTNVSLKSE